MFCGFKMANPELAARYDHGQNCFIEKQWDCEKELCELWDKDRKRCGLAASSRPDKIDEARGRA